MQTISRLLKKKFIGTDDFRRDLTNILASLQKSGGEIVVTQHGKPRAILVDVDDYIELQDQILDQDPKLIKEINAAIADVKAGNGIPAEEVFKELGI